MSASSKLTARARIPATEKGFFVRRTKRSPSFRSRGVGRYCFVRNGKNVYLKAKVSKEFPSGTDSFAIVFMGKNKRRIGNISCVTGGSYWDIWDRIINNRAFRGHGLGKLGFRLAEQIAKKRGGKTIYLHAFRKDELAVALSLGYGLMRGSEKNLKRLLGLNVKKPLPDKGKLVELLRREAVPYDQWNFAGVQAVSVEKVL